MKKPSKGKSRRIAAENLQAGVFTLAPETSHYVSTVLRLGPGDPLVLFDGKGQEAQAEIQSVSPDGVVVDARAPVSRPRTGPEVTVAAAVPKGERSDWMVEKLAELGVARILWLETQRSVVKPRPEGKRFGRWRRIAQSGARQSGQALVTVVEGPLSVENLCNSDNFSGVQGWVADAGGEDLRSELLQPPQRAVLVVGPEGGLTGHELAVLTGAGYNFLRLSPHVLRVETAALVGASLLVGP